MQIENILIIFLSGLSFSLIFLYFQSLKNIKSLSKLTIDLLFKNSTFQDDIDADKNLILEDTHRENFIKFLSDSRNWAFEYIDKSQKQIKEFVDIADKEFAFFDKYGILSEGDLHYNTMKTISEEYKKLKILLPEENNDRRQGDTNL